MTAVHERLTLERVRERVDAVPDPELPLITLGDLGVVRAVTEAPDGAVEVTVTPTYTGCPALDVIEAEIRAELARCGHADGRVRSVLSPAWTTDRITAEGRRKLAENGISPPGSRSAPLEVRIGTGAACPHCGSTATRPQSPFGVTRCQSLLACTGCGESFGHMKAI
ncbi:MULTISPECIES: 1,2-phenylacetyl-CoA epoxidase subunit PaaD [unclassified Streptomyces]|uniref:1,2-phenylacetyl-CoA epoxidase subunit PaaD n=1 Tax=unclassified Streptomyces TaxID=2593676 RepID=UPI0022B6A079|nr:MULTISPECIES: 1,2-phenylacetyl-CoA epoxidase subunit PaaD [unclassified Streptomyces]MCZ7417818.1 phenylacetate-CoA oxygenase subunit PaaJ [Streptomyces sp. WMMC897]MCZ7432377.1 phenylacetate-CoA oxygenase subunit PaaJ [Streptomyces sp. WMMC1477]